MIVVYDKDCIFSKSVYKTNLIITRKKIYLIIIPSGWFQQLFLIFKIIYRLFIVLVYFRIIYLFEYFRVFLKSNRCFLSNFSTINLFVSEWNVTRLFFLYNVFFLLSKVSVYLTFLGPFNSFTLIYSLCRYVSFKYIRL